MPIAPSARLGVDVRIPHPDLVNLYGCDIDDGATIGPFVEIQSGVRVGRRCKISSHSFLCSGVTLEDEVFVGHGVMFVNDKLPRATTEAGTLKTEADWVMLETLVRRRASIGSNASILGGLTIGVEAQVGAGSVVTKDVPDYAIVAGVPARVLGDVRERASRPRGG
jgi:UDP-2-acetamido-3-amino-2,3-dideoxy-glucuronate N-acetyltransferase